MKTNNIKRAILAAVFGAAATTAIAADNKTEYTVTEPVDDSFVVTFSKTNRFMQATIKSESGDIMKDLSETGKTLSTDKIDTVTNTIDYTIRLKSENPMTVDEVRAILDNLPVEKLSSRYTNESQYEHFSPYKNLKENHGIVLDNETGPAHSHIVNGHTVVTEYDDGKLVGPAYKVLYPNGHVYENFTGTESALGNQGHHVSRYPNGSVHTSISEHVRGSGYSSASETVTKDGELVQAEYRYNGKLHSMSGPAVIRTMEDGTKLEAHFIDGYPARLIPNQCTGQGAHIDKDHTNVCVKPPQP